MSNNKYAGETMHSETGGKIVLSPAGNHLSVCIGIVSLGTINKDYDGHPKKTKCLRAYFELTNTKNEEDEGRPFIVSEEYTDSLHSNSNLRKLLTGWFGPITDKEADGFNLVNLIGCQGMCNVAIVKGEKSGKERNKIMGMTPIPEGVPMPELKGEPFLFNFNPPFKIDEFNNLEKWIQDIIKESDEYKAMEGVDVSAPAQAAAAPKATTTGKRPF